MIEICRVQVHTGTSHIFCPTTTVIPCVLVIGEAIGTRKSLKLILRDVGPRTDCADKYL
jgi:hypothetical protein